MLLDLAAGVLGAASPVERARRGAIGGALLAGFALTAWVALLGALRAALLPLVGPAWAWLALAGLALAGALVTWGVGAWLAARARARAQAQRTAALETALAELALGTLPRMLRDHPVLSLALAAAAGFAAMPGPERPESEA